MAFGVISVDNSKRKISMGTEWPLVVNEDNENLGLFGGLSSGYNQNGDLEITMLFISSAGYIAPILNSGGIATVSVSYFQNKDCSGPEFQSATIIMPGFSPYRGMVFRSLATNNLGYIQKNERSEKIKTQSHLKLGHGGLVECEESIVEIEAYEVIHNNSELTGIDMKQNYGLASVAGRDVSHVSGGKRNSSEYEISGDGDNNDDDVNGIAQEECSPACLTNTLGNGVCDIECYVESCYFDKDDCNTLAPDELQMKLSRICSPGCDIGDIGDGFCDKPCNTQTCQHDGGDCKQQ